MAGLQQGLCGLEVGALLREVQNRAGRGLEAARSEVFRGGATREQ